MKKTQTLAALIAMFVCLNIGLISCSDNEKDEPAVATAKNIEGFYGGDIVCTVMGTEYVYEGNTITLTATDDATVTATISSFGGGEHNMMPSINIPGIKVSSTEGVYTLATTEFSGISDAGKAYSGTIKAIVSGRVIDTQFTLNYGAMPMPMVCSLKGTKQ